MVTHNTFFRWVREREEMRRTGKICKYVDNFLHIRYN